MANIDLCGIVQLLRTLVEGLSMHRCTRRDIAFAVSE